MAKGLKGQVGLLAAAFFSKAGKKLEFLRQAWREEAKCGCGIDCCYGALVLTDQDTGEYTYIYVKGGEVLTTTDPKKDLVKVGDGVTA